jgi:hypothetical protein
MFRHQKKGRFWPTLLILTILTLTHLGCGVKISPEKIHIITGGKAATPTPAPATNTPPPAPAATPTPAYDVIEAAIDVVATSIPVEPLPEPVSTEVEPEPPPISNFSEVSIVGVVDKNTVEVMVDGIPYQLPYVSLPPAPPSTPQYPAEWDSRLTELGITLSRAQRQSGQPVFRLVKALYQDETEAGGLHHIFVEVLDKNGQRILGQPVIQAWDDGQATLITEDKPHPEYAANVPMYSAIGSGEYKIYVDGYPSDVVDGLGLPAGHLVNYLLTFQRKQY